MLLQPRLSICIPTYNFGAFISQTLESIVCQIEPNVEIDVLDGGSTDNTAAIMADWRTRHPAIRYHRQPTRGGIDRDMARVVELSRGNYFWLFSADDLMVEGALSRVLCAIEDGHDVCLGTHRVSDFQMRPLRPAHPVLALDDNTDFDLTSESARERYCRLARSSEAFFSFLGGLVVRRSTWDSVLLDEAFVGSCWAHAARLLVLMKRGIRLRYLHEPIGDRRSDNDSFADRGLVHRCSIAIDGYNRIAHTIFGRRSCEARAIRRVIGREYTLRSLLDTQYRIAGRPDEDAADLDRLARMTFSDSTVRNLARRCLWRVLPVAAYPFYRSLWRAGKVAAGGWVRK